MICQTIRNKYDNQLVQYDSLDITKMLKNPSNKPKDELPQWMFVDLINPSNKYRNQDNYDNIYCLMIEFDATTTIKEFESKYSHYKYALYTTSRHTPECNKFRVLLPLNQPHKYRTIKHPIIKQVLINHFPGIDASCFSNFQKIPVLPQNPSDYYYKFNKGEVKFGLNLLADEINKAKMVEKGLADIRNTLDSLRAKQVNFNYEAYKAKVDVTSEALLAALPLSETGDRYTSMCSAMGKLLGASYPDGTYIYHVADIAKMIRPICWDKVIQSALKKFASKRNYQ